MKFLLLFLASFISQLSCARYITGRVTDDNKSPVEYANVMLYGKDSTFIEGTVTDSCGIFTLHDDKAAAFFRVSCVGYFSGNIDISGQAHYDIVLRQDSTMLGDVVVRGRMPRYTRVKGGYSVAVRNSILERLINAGDILASLPRVRSNDGKLTVFGKGTPEIYVNERKLRDVQELALLKPADIERVTVLTNSGVRYGSEVRSVIIIKTRKKQGDGLSGSVDATYGQKDKASLCPDVNFNWRSGRLDVFGFAAYDNKYATDRQEIGQTIHGNSHRVDEEISGMRHSMRTQDMRGKLGIDYLINDSNSIGFEYHLAKDLGSQYMRSHYDDKQYLDSRLQDNIGYRTGATPDNGPSNELDAYYNGKIRRVSITFDGTYYSGRRRLKTVTDEHGSEGDVSVNSSKKSKSDLLATKLVAGTDLSDNLSLELGMEYNHSRYRQSYYNKEGIIDSRDNKIDESNVAGLLSADYTLGDFELSAGVRYEHTRNFKYENGIKNTDVSRIYNRLYPDIDLSYNGEDFNLGLSYEITSEKPSYADLSSVVAYNSRYLYEGGNPNLDMTVEHTLELSGAYRDLSFSLSYETDKDAITRWGRLYNAHDDIILLTNTNIPTLKLLYFSLSAEPAIAFWHPLAEFDFQQQFIDDMGLGRNFNKPIMQMILNNRFVFKRTMFGVSYVLRTSGADGYTFTKSYQRFDAFLAINLLKGKLQAKLQADDIFKSSKAVNEMYTPNYNIRQVTIPSYRNFSLTVSYNFNKTHKRYLGTGAGTAEKSRL